MQHVVKWLGRATVCSLVGSCAPAEDTRPQLVVHLTTDLLPAGLLPTNPLYSASATVDTVRVDVIQTDGVVREFREFSVSDPTAWPLSFGVPPLEASPLRLRLRLFRGADAHAERLNGLTVVEPDPQLTVDRVVLLPIPVQGISHVHIALAGACMGLPASFLGAGSSCVNAEQPSAPFTDGVSSEELTLGTFALALDAPCTGTPRPNALCIPGGLTVLGNEALAASAASNVQPAPLRVVAVSPFFMDTTEYTVGRYRESVARAGGPPRPPATGEDSLGLPCTFAEDSADTLPLNCVDAETAALLCSRDGGRLPTEAEWEFAASGRGQRRPFPWGETLAACCSSALAQYRGQGIVGECPPAPLGAVGAHADPTTCDAAMDVSRDGILDLAGSLSELTSDTLVPYGALGIERDPRTPAVGLPVARGGNYTASRLSAAVALREVAISTGGYLGFRCIYEASQ